MRSVCICGSFKFYDEMVQLRETLLARGVLCEWPAPGPRRDPTAMTAEEAREGIMRHLERMDRADFIFIFIFNKDTYTGTSVVMKIGYAYARRKPIYSLTPVTDAFLSGLVTAVVGVDELLTLALHNKKAYGSPPLRPLSPAR